MPRLAVGLVISIAVHLAPILVARHFANQPALVFDMQVHAVEIGLESPQEGARQLPAPATPRTPTPQPPQHTTAARPETSHATPLPPERETAALPTIPAPRTQLREPQMQLTHATPHLVQPDEQLRSPLASADAGAPQVPQGLPSIADAAGDLAPMVPRGALFTIMIRTDRVRLDPNANAVRGILSAIPDWDMMIGGTQLDPIRDLDEIVLAAANPMGAEGQAPDWFVLAKGTHGSDAALRMAVEEMAAQDRAAHGDHGTASVAPSPVNPPDMDGGPGSNGVEATARPDAGRPSIWRSVHGFDTAEIDRYGARRNFMMLGNGQAAIALPGQVESLVAALARRGPALASRDDPRLSMLIEAEGIRNTISFNTWRGPFPIPTRAGLGIYQQGGEAGRPTGAVELRSEWQYDTHAEAEHGREMFEYSRGRWHAMIAERLGQQGGLGRLLAGAAASLVGIDIDGLESAIDALQFRTEENRLVIHADLDARQVRALLNAASLGRGDSP